MITNAKKRVRSIRNHPSNSRKSVSFTQEFRNFLAPIEREDNRDQQD